MQRKQLVIHTCLAALLLLGTAAARAQPSPSEGTNSPRVLGTDSQEAGSFVQFVYVGRCEAAQLQDQADPKAPKPIDERITGVLNTWWDLTNRWKYLYWIALASSLVLSTLIATNFLPDTPRFKAKSLAGFGAALSAAFLATFNPQAQAERYLRGYLYLKSAIIHYQSDPGMTVCHLSQAYARAESIIHGGSASTATTATK
jgi:hypothetical protein